MCVSVVQSWKRSRVVHQPRANVAAALALMHCSPVLQRAYLSARDVVAVPPVNAPVTSARPLMSVTSCLSLSLSLSLSLCYSVGLLSFADFLGFYTGAIRLSDPDQDSQ